MAVFEIQGPDGRMFEVEGADAAGAVSAFRGYIGAQTEPSPPAAAAGSATATVPDGEATGAPSLWQLMSGGREAWDRAADAVGRVAGAVDAGVRSAADAATFGLGDEFAARMAALTGIGGARGDYEGNLAAQEAASAQAAEDHPTASTVGGLAGAVALPMGAARHGATLAGRFGTGAMTGLGGVAARSGLMAVEGAGYGAANAAGRGEDIASGAAIGGALGAAGNVVAEGVGHVASNVAGRIGRAAGVNRNPAVPSQDDIRKAGNAAYDAAERAGVIYNSAGTSRLAREVTDDLAQFGYDPALQPRVATVVSRLNDISSGNVTLKGLEQIRKIANNARAGSMDASERALLNGVIQRLDDFALNARPGEVLTGDAAAGAAALKEARGRWQQLKKLDEIETATRRAELRAASTGKGANVDNATRQNVRRIVEKGARGYTPDERAALEKIVRGARDGQDVARQISQGAPTGIVSTGLGTQLGAGVGSFLGGPAGAMAGTVLVPAVGAVAKRAADRATVANVDDLLRIIAAGGSRAAAFGAPNAAQRAIDAAVPVVPGALSNAGSGEFSESRAKRRRKRAKARRDGADERGYQPPALALP